jgi:DNA-binding IclR family transcriptional regulator
MKEPYKNRKPSAPLVILSYMMGEGSHRVVTPHELHENIGMSRTTVHRALYDLMSHNLVVRVSRGVYAIEREF